MANKDRWAKNWKMHQDPNGILKGIKDLEFELVRVNSGHKFDIYDFVYEYVTNDGTPDPFLDTQFIGFGKEFPDSPSAKLEPWNATIDPEYVKLIEDTFASAPANIVRLFGQKEVKGEKEFFVLLLIPEAIDTGVGNPRYVDLIFAACSTKLSALTADAFRQDGTAHGNPR